MAGMNRIDDITKGSNGSNITTTNSSTVTEEERQRYLDQLQAETTIIMIPSIVFLVTLAVVGFIGNSLVIVVYIRRQKWSSTNVFILTLAFVDLMANVVVIPGYICNLFHFWQYESRALCKVQISSATFVTLSSGMVLVALSVMRYRKVCKPHNWQVTPRRAQIICVVVFTLGVVFTIPNAIIKGKSTIKIPYRDIVAYQCSTDDEFVDTIWPLLYLVFFLMMYSVCSGCLIVMYVLIGKEAWRHRTIHGTREISMNTSVGWKDNVKSQNQTSPCLSIASSCVPNTNMSAKAQVDADRTSSAQQGGQSYLLRFIADRVDTRTQNVGDFFVKLQKEKSEVDVLDFRDCEVSKDKNQRNEDRSQHGSNSQTYEAAWPTVTKESNTLCRTIKKERSSILSYVKQNYACIGDMATDRVLRGCTAGENMRLCDEVYNAAITRHSRQNSETTYASPGRTVQNHRNSSTYDRQSLYKKDSVHSNLLSIFKWLDVIYCSHVHSISLNSYAAGNEDNISFRMSLDRIKPQRTEWVRSSSMETTRISHNNSNDVKGEAAALPQAEIRTVNFFKGKHESDVKEKIQIPVGSRTSTENKCEKNVCINAPDVMSSSTTSTVKRSKWNRTTLMLVAISAIYSLGYVPFLILLFLQLVFPETVANMSTISKSIYFLFFRSFFLNCAVNPIVYSLCDNKFRKECKQLFKRS